MRISDQSVNEARVDYDNRIEGEKTSDRFSQALKNDQARRDDEKKANDKKDGQDVHKDGPAPAPAPSPVAERAQVTPSPAVGGNDSSSPAVSSSASAAASKTSHPAATTPPQIDGLATEVGHHIDIFKQDGKTSAINITFDSKTLEGLHVQIRQQDGELAIRFVSQSDNVSKLLSRHTGDLREALENKGVKIRNIAISNPLTQPALQRNRDAGA
jgi:flagellar hook-length control protein FliK